MKKALYFIISVFVLISCEDNKKDFIEKDELDKMLSTSEYKILDTIRLKKSEVLEIYQDEGALGGSKFHLCTK